MQQRGAQKACLLDHLVGAREQRRRNSEAERLSRDQVDDQIEFGRLSTAREAVVSLFIPLSPLQNGMSFFQPATCGILDQSRR